MKLYGKFITKHVHLFYDLFCILSFSFCVSSVSLLLKEKNHHNNTFQYDKFKIMTIFHHLLHLLIFFSQQLILKQRNVKQYLTKTQCYCVIIQIEFYIIFTFMFL